jgi:serine/threonine protein kinase/tetratricopeptide (TPR) repeat protein
MPLSLGDFLGPYQILSPIGKGGMGEVYRAVDTRMGRDVAIKVVAEPLSGRFTREVRTIAALNHPNICTIHDVGPNYLVMEYVEGAPLKGPMPEPTAIALARQIAAALEAAHAKGIVHRDLKPANILRVGDSVKLLDFGIATLAQPAIDDGPASPATLASLASNLETVVINSRTQSETLPFASVKTRAGETLGTPAYMSPEQSEGRPVDARSDIFSFGAVLYEMLTGQRAFAGATVGEAIMAVQRHEPVLLEASTEVVRIVTRCLRKNPAERYQGIAEVRIALEKAAAALGRKSPSVAVLPFIMAGANVEDEYFGDGLTEDIINALSGVAGLKVIARTSTFAFKHSTQDIRGIAESLGADHVLEGSVRMAGPRIRVTTRLITAQDGTQLWSKRYDRDLHDVFVIQDEISNAIATELKVSLTRQTLVKAPTEHFAAYQEVLRGRHHFYRFHPEEQAKALACFERAVSIDPEYAAAHIGIALYHWGQMVVGMAPPEEAMARSLAAAGQAMRLDPANSEAHHIFGSYFAVRECNWAEAERYFRRALALNPNSLDACHCYNLYCLGPLGRFEEALTIQEFALAQDPLSLHMNYLRAIILECLGRDEHEAEAIERLDQLEPNFAAGQLLLVRLRARQQRVAEALEVAERAIRNGGRWAMTLGALGIAYAADGQAARANDVIAELECAPGAESRAYYAALIAAALGDADSAFHWAAESIEHHDHLMPLFLRTSSFDRFRGAPRWAGLLGMVKLEGAEKR